MYIKVLFAKIVLSMNAKIELEVKIVLVGD